LTSFVRFPTKGARLWAQLLASETRFVAFAGNSDEQRTQSFTCYDGDVAKLVDPLILALDTTQEHGSLALYRGEKSLECREVSAPLGFSRVIFYEIQDLLKAHGASLHDVDLYGVAAGPGSFTGVRVGLTAAKALSKVHGKLVAPVSNLAAIAWLAWEEWGGRPRLPGSRGDAATSTGVDACPTVLIPILDARRKELYAGVYERTEPAGYSGRAAESGPGAGWRPLTEDVVVLPARLEERLAEMNLPEDRTAYCGPDVEKFELNAFPRLVTGRAIAGAVAEFALAAWLAGGAQSPDDADANYVRRSDAEIFSKPWM
jgi:tRNA threonylcarbamoyladenosine biosynthesis protein TsaB